MSPTIASMTTAPRVAPGRFSNSVARNSIVARMNTALINDASSDFWPASSATEVFDRLPSTTKPPTSPAAPFAIPCAMSS